MSLPEVYLSAPAVRLPLRKVGNDEILARVRAAFRGTDEAWAGISRRIELVLKQCGSHERYFEDAPLPIAGHVARVARDCLAAQRLSPEALDVVVYGGIPREYFEPATATEVASNLGAHHAAAYDVAAACAGLLVGVTAFVGQAAVDERVQTGIVACADLTVDRLSYDVQTPEALELLAAGLTLGNASAAFALARRPLPASGRVVAVLTECLPEHHALTRAPIDGVFTCRSAELFALARYVPDHVRRLVDRAGWALGDVAFIASHQPSVRLLRDVAGALGIDPVRVPAVHDRYGNTAASSVALAMDDVVRRGLRPGDKVILSSQAAGFTMCSIALEWAA